MKLPKSTALEVFKWIVKLDHPTQNELCHYLLRTQKETQEKRGVEWFDYVVAFIDRGVARLKREGYLIKGSRFITKGYPFTEKGKQLEKYLKEIGKL